MASTESYDIAGEWTQVGDGYRNIAIQHQRQGTIEVHVGDGAPDPSDVGIVIGTSLSGLPSTFALSSLSDGAQVWVRSANTARIVVMAY